MFSKIDKIFSSKFGLEINNRYSMKYGTHYNYAIRSPPNRILAITITHNITEYGEIELTLLTFCI